MREKQALSLLCETQHKQVKLVDFAEWEVPSSCQPVLNIKKQQDNFTFHWEQKIVILLF